MIAQFLLLFGGGVFAGCFLGRFGDSFGQVVLTFLQFANGCLWVAGQLFVLLQFGGKAFEFLRGGLLIGDCLLGVALFQVFNRFPNGFGVKRCHGGVGAFGLGAGSQFVGSIEKVLLFLDERLKFVCRLFRFLPQGLGQLILRLGQFACALSEFGETVQFLFPCGFEQFRSAIEQSLQLSREILLLIR